MDETTSLFLTVDADREGQEFEISALITEDGIQVGIEVVLGTLKPYIKNAVLYPNPTDGVIQLEYLVYRRMDQLSAQLIDMNGRVLIEQDLEYQLGQQLMEMDMRELQSGMYILKLKNENDEFTFSTRIMKN